MAIDTRNHNRTLLDTLPFADLSLTRKDVESDKGTVKKPLTLLDLPTEIRLMILNEVFAEIKYGTYPWCYKCRRSQKETGHKSQFELGGPSCNSYMVWMAQPSPKQTGPVVINKKLYNETIDLFRQATICHYPLSKGENYPEQISANLQTLKVDITRLFSLWPIIGRVERNHLPKLKTIILPNKLEPVPFSQTILYGIEKSLRTKARDVGIEEGADPVYRPFVTIPIPYPAPFHTSDPQLWQKRMWTETKSALNSCDVKIEFPLTFTVEVERYPSDGQSEACWTKIVETTAVWDKHGVTLPNHCIPNFNKECPIYFWEGKVVLHSEYEGYISCTYYGFD